MNSREREAEKRRTKLADIDTRVADGSLTVRPMTGAERERFGIGDPDRPHRRFFYPGAPPGTRRSEESYRSAIRALREAIDGRPTERRVFRVDCAVDGVVCRLQVGEPLGSSGDVVVAIFELRGENEIVISTEDEPAALRVSATGADVLEFA